MLVVGASARAAVQSAWRAGLRTTAIDLFGDRDLRAHGPALRIAAADYPAGLRTLARQLPPGPWIYTGALENHPDDLLAGMAQDRPLWGNGPEAVRAVRDPFRVADTLRRAGLPAAGLRVQPEGVPRDGSWLVKPLASAGGRRIAPFGPAAVGLDEPHYFQERVVGSPCAAVFLAAPVASRLLGVTWQRIGRPGAPFAYAGSVGPVPIATGVRRQLDRMGQILTSEFGLRGLFGVDFVLRDGMCWAVEVNPRYTASVEVLELATGIPHLRLHAEVFDPALRGASPPSSRSHNSFRINCFGKAILFAPTACDAPAGPALGVPWTRLRGSPMADLPWPGTAFRPGDPVWTVFARGRTPAEVMRRLDWMLARSETCLDNPGGGAGAEQTERTGRT